jgi:hypothetical protein
MDESKFFKCDCHTHGVEVLISNVEVSDEKEILLMLWKYNPNDSSVPFWTRLKSSYQYLFRRKSLYANEVILNREKSLELSEWIITKMGD